MKYCKLLLFFKEVHNIGLFHEDILNLNPLFIFPKLWWVCGCVCVCLVLDVVCRRKESREGKFLAVEEDH